MWLFQKCFWTRPDMWNMAEMNSTYSKNAWHYWKYGGYLQQSDVSAIIICAKCVYQLTLVASKIQAFLQHHAQKCPSISSRFPHLETDYSGPCLPDSFSSINLLVSLNCVYTGESRFRVAMIYRRADKSLARPGRKQTTFPAFYGTWRLISTFTRVHHLSLP